MTNSGSLIIEQDTATSITLTVDLENAAAANTRNDIRALTTGEANYALEVEISDTDLAVSGATNGLSSPGSVTVTSLTSGTFHQGLVAGDAATSFETTVSVSVSAANCPTATHVCITLTKGAQGTYTDANTAETSNKACAVITSNLVCAPGKIALSLQLDSHLFQ